MSHRHKQHWHSSSQSPLDLHSRERYQTPYMRHLQQQPLLQQWIDENHMEDLFGRECCILRIVPDWIICSWHIKYNCVSGLPTHMFCLVKMVQLFVIVRLLMIVWSFVIMWFIVWHSGCHVHFDLDFDFDLYFTTTKIVTYIWMLNA